MFLCVIICFYLFFIFSYFFIFFLIFSYFFLFFHLRRPSPNSHLPNSDLILRVEVMLGYQRVTPFSEWSWDTRPLPGQIAVGPGAPRGEFVKPPVAHCLCPTERLRCPTCRSGIMLYVGIICDHSVIIRCHESLDVWLICVYYIYIIYICNYICVYLVEILRTHYPHCIVYL